MKNFYRYVSQICCILFVVCGLGFSQTVSSNLTGTLTDQSDLAVPGIEVTVTNEATGAARAAQTNAIGLFRFNNLAPGIYTLSVQAEGFKSYEQRDLSLASSETRNLGRIVLEIGTVVEEISVVAQAVAVQTASSEKSSLVDGNQLNTIALKGRDPLAMLSLLPGIVDTANRSVATPGGFGSISINAGGDTNFTVDGVTNLDTGSNGTVHYVPNMDTVSEIRVLTSNYQAEFGRSAGGVISMVTKGGGQEFHGTGWWNKRHEQFNAVDFFDNREGVAKTAQRFDIFGYTVGGPIVIPKTFNTQKNKLFFFVSQEWTKRIPPRNVGYANMPTALERAGDFSDSRDSRGRVITIDDPTTGKPFPGNKIDPSRVSQTGLAMLNFFPMPNWEDPDPNQVYRRNYRSVAVGKYPRRSDMARIDTNVNNSNSAYFRITRDYDNAESLGSHEVYSPVEGAWVNHTQLHPNPGWGLSTGVTSMITPTVINELVVGKSYNSWSWYLKYPDAYQRDRMNSPPHWFNEADMTTEYGESRVVVGPSDLEGLNYALYIPSVNFGGGSTTGQTSFNSNRPYTNYNNIFSITDNVSWVKGEHSVKAGLYYEHTGKVQQGNAGSYLGQYHFGSSSDMPNDSKNGYANAYLGNVQYYQEGARKVMDVVFDNLEVFVQDSWRAHPRLTVDVGIRFAWMPPQHDLNLTSASFYPSKWELSAAPRLYYPAVIDGKAMALDTATGQTTFATLIGTYVPNSGDLANGFRQGGVDPSIPWGHYSTPGLVAAPRIGFAWDIFGTGKTAIRAGFGMFYNRGDGNEIHSMSTNPPVAYSGTIYYSNIANVRATTDPAIAPRNITFVTDKQPLENTMNWSFGIQQDVGFSTVLDVSYVGQGNRNMQGTRDINAIPIFARYNPANADPRTGRSVSDVFLRPYYGHDSLNYRQYGFSSNYHSLQASVRRSFRDNLSYGFSYTWAKTLGVYGRDPYFDDKERYYGRANNSRAHVLSVNYTYDLPKLGQRLGNKAVGAVLDNWTISGVNQFQTGAPFAPTFSWSGSAPEQTGSSTGARIDIIGNPIIPKGERTLERVFNTEAFAPPEPCSWERQTMACFGNSGVNYMTGPGVNNWDMTLAKHIPLGEERSLTFRAEAYNVWNHTQFSSVDSSASYRVTTGEQIDGVFGQYTATRSPREISLTLRAQF